MLYSDFVKNTENSIHKWPHYFPIYERHFSKYKNQGTILWEIGVGGGGSLQMWKRYLGPFAIIIGLDIRPECLEYEDDQIFIRIGNQSDTLFLQNIINEFGTPHIIIDDGSHVMSDINNTFEFMYDKLNSNGIYLVEDLHTAYWPEWEGGLHRKGTFVESCKDYIDSLNARYCNLDTHFADMTFSMCFYDSVVVFEKTIWSKNKVKPIRTPANYYNVTSNLTLCDENNIANTNIHKKHILKEPSYKYNAVFKIGEPICKEHTIILELSIDEIENMYSYIIHFHLDYAKIVYENGQKACLTIESVLTPTINNGHVYSFVKESPKIVFKSDGSNTDKPAYIHIQAVITPISLKSIVHAMKNK